MTSSSGCLSIAMSLDCWYETVSANLQHDQRFGSGGARSGAGYDAASDRFVLTGPCMASRLSRGVGTLMRSPSTACTRVCPRLSFQVFARGVAADLPLATRSLSETNTTGEGAPHSP